MNANLFDVLMLLLALLGAYLFWQWRLQEEHARKHAEAICKKYNVQFLDIARSHGKPRFTPRTGWEAGFQFGFSSDIQTRYEGELILLNLNLRDVTMPPHRAHAMEEQNAIPGETVASTENSAASQKQSQPQVTPTRGAHQIPAPVTTFNMSYGERKSQDTTASKNAESDLPPIVDAIFPEDLANQSEGEKNDAPPIHIDGFSNTDG